MYYAVSQLKDGIAAMLSGIDLDTAVNPNEAIQRAIRTTSAKVSIPDANLRTPYLIYDGVTDYLAPSNLFGGSFTDFRIQGASRNWDDLVYRKQIEDFDRTKSFANNGVKMTLEWMNSIPLLRVKSARSNPKTTIDTMSAVGNWAVTGSAGGLYVDSTVYWNQPAALGFNLAANQTSGGIQETLTNSLNLSSYLGSGCAFVAVYLPSAAAASAISSVTLDLGSDMPDYYSISASAPTIGLILGQYFMLFPFPLSSATIVGNPNLSAIKYAAINFTYSSTSAINNIRIGAFFVSLPLAYELLYQSAAIFLPQTGPNLGIPQQTITTDNDLVMLNDEIYNLFLHECAIAVANDNGADLSNPVVVNLATQLNGTRTRTGLVVTYGLYDLYRSRHPSEEIPTVGSYYF